MIIPESLWQPSAKDLVAQFAPGRASRRILLSSANATNFIDLYTVPVDQVLLLQYIDLLGTTAGVTTVTDITCEVRDATAELFVLSRHTPAALRSDGLNSPPASKPVSVVMMPKEILRMTAVYSAAVAGNVLVASFTGVLIPRGNWQFG